MIIRNCNLLLEELTDLENKISEIESQITSKNLNLDLEEILNHTFIKER